MKFREGKYTVEKFALDYHLTRQSAINLLSKLKKQGYVIVSGGGKQKRIYNVYKLKKRVTNGFYDIVNKYSPKKLNPRFEHYVNGSYNVENAIIDGIKIGDIRTLDAVMYLFNHVKNWKKLFDLAKKNNLTNNLIKLYKKSRASIKCRKIPKRYIK